MVFIKAGFLSTECFSLDSKTVSSIRVFQRFALMDIPIPMPISVHHVVSFPAEKGQRNVIL